MALIVKLGQYSTLLNILLFFSRMYVYFQYLSGKDMPYWSFRFLASYFVFVCMPLGKLEFAFQHPEVPEFVQIQACDMTVLLTQ